MILCHNGVLQKKKKALRDIKPELRSKQDLNLLWLDALTTESLELWHWSRDRHNSIPSGSQVQAFYSVGAQYQSTLSDE